MVTISTLMGSESIPNASRSVRMYATNMAGKRLQLAYRPASESQFPAGRNLRPEVGGELLNRTFDIPDNTLLRVVGLIQRQGHGSKTRRVMIRVDSRAPYNRLKVPTSGHHRSVSPAMYIEGRFWVLPQEEALKHVHPVYQPMYMNVFDVFEPVEQVHPGAELPVIEQKTIQVDGEDKKVTISRPKRALRL